MVEDTMMGAVRVPLIITMNWNPAYGYSELPAGYTQATLPAHRKAMLAKVDPVQGTPHFRNVRIAVTKVGAVDFAKTWQLTNVGIKADDNAPVAVKNSADVRF